ncbi:unnamed protein product [Paramecium pentaurelia]|uniref:Uncharacterized protein n=1 Tax=Paramecium pentaurelia TaxID=43138 RepID=A0A8S1UP88_9CILI|nr:unnamed protein product [Paramecium pentaurelia]
MLSKYQDQEQLFNWRCNLSGSEFYNVNISGRNLNGSQLFYCSRKNLKILELNQLVGHTYDFKQVCLSLDGSTLASSSYDYSICFWDIKTGKQMELLDNSKKIIQLILKQHFSRYLFLLSISQPLILQFSIIQITFNLIKKYLDLQSQFGICRAKDFRTFLV